MAEKRAFHRSRIFYILSGIAVLALVSGVFFWRNYKYKLANKTLDKLVTVKSKGLYQIHYSNLIINEVAGSISMDSIEITADSSVYHELVSQDQAPENLFTIHIPKLHISGVKTPKAVLNKELSAHRIVIENAVVEARLGHAAKGKNTRSDKELYEQLLGNLKSILADSISIVNASLKIVDIKTNHLRGDAKGIDIDFSGLAIDSLAHLDTTRIAFSRELSFHCKQADIPDKNRKYTLQLYEINFSTVTGDFHLKQMKYKQKLSEAAFAKSNIFAADRFDIEMGKVDVWNINRDNIIHGKLVADSLMITDGFFRIFRDKSYPHDSVDRTHSYPQEAIMRLPLKMNLHTVLFRNCYIEYKEKNNQSDSSGKVAFHHVNASLENVTNMEPVIAKNDLMRLHFKSSFLNTTPFSADITMHLNDRNGRFVLEADMGAIQAASLNSLLKPMALAELSKGQIKKLHYHLTATNKRGQGRLLLYYDDLSVKLLKKDDEKNKYKTKFLPTLAAGIVLKSSNPSGGKTRTGEVDYERDIHRSMFNMMWKSLFACIKQVAL